MLDFGTDYALSGPVTRWPRPYQTGILTGFHNEQPNPVVQFGRTCTSTDPCGYPVSMTWYKGAVKYTSITLKRASDGLAISGYRLSPQNDQFHNWSTSLSFIPQKALAYNTKYTASFQGKFNPTYGSNPDNGTAFSYTWSFTTLPPPGKLVSSSPVNGATGTSQLPSISLSFSRSLRVYTLVGTPYSALRTGGIGMSLARASDGAELGIAIAQPTTTMTKTVSLQPTTTLAANTRYRLSYTLVDMWGRPQRGTLYFTTGS